MKPPAQKKEVIQVATIYQMDLDFGGFKPIEVDSKNNLPAGTVLHLHGYNEPEYVIIRNLGVDARFRGYGAMYDVVDLETYQQSKKEASSLYWPSDGRKGIHTEITDRVIPESEVKVIWAKSEELRVQADEKRIIAETEYAKLVEKGRVLVEKHIPAEAKALIVASRHVDASDPISDYHNHQTAETVILAWSPHTKDLFSEMRKAALKIPETVHLGPGKGHFEAHVVIGEDFEDNGRYYHHGACSPWHNDISKPNGEYPIFATRDEAVAFSEQQGLPFSMTFNQRVIPFEWSIIESNLEHREKWSMGAGYYLKDGHRDSDGWCVSKVTKYGENWDAGLFACLAKRCVFEDDLAPKTCECSVDASNGIAITENIEKGGIEIRFSSKPAKSVIDKLKDNGWRWSRFGGLWYNKATDGNREFARSLSSAIPEDLGNSNQQPLKEQGNAKTANKLRALADGMEKTIDSKINSGISQQNPTRRRLLIAEGMRREGEKMQQVQYLLRALADMHECGNIPAELKCITSKTAAHEALFGYGDSKIQAAIDIANRKPQEDPKAKTLRELNRELIGCKIPGFFITPPDTAKHVVELADIQEGHSVCEPEAGRGDIAQFINHGSKLTCIEFNSRLADILKMRGFDTIHGDFLEHVEMSYDRIVMNPPFENGQDIDHVRHAYDLLKPNGRVVAIMGEGVFFRQDRKHSEFREWLDNKPHEIESLKPGTFMGTITPTQVATRIVVIDKLN